MASMDSEILWLDSQQDSMVGLLTALAGMNSFSNFRPGLDAVAERLRKEFIKTLAPDVSEVIQTTTGKLLRFAKHPQADRRILLVIHYDTVYPPDGVFQHVTRTDDGLLHGPGVADAKGGIVVMLHALAANERLAAAGDQVANRLGWEVILNPDEEIGSPGSSPLLLEAAGRAQLAMVFEPAPSHTQMAIARKGSGNFTATIHGRSAHAGREIEKGRNAILAAARFALEATAAISAIGDGVTINVSKVDGGGPANVVPDLAIVHFNIRVTSGNQQSAVEHKLAELIRAAGQPDGISAELKGHFTSPPWTQSDAGKSAFARLQALGRELGLSLEGMTSGGASDANKIAQAGIPVLDSLGPVGHHIHSPAECVEIATLTERAKLAAMMMLDFANE